MHGNAHEQLPVSAGSARTSRVTVPEPGLRACVYRFLRYGAVEKRKAMFWKTALRKWASSKAEGNKEGALPDGFLRMGSYQPDDLFIIGFPKSGHTWTQNLIAEALYGFSAETTPFQLIQDLAPDIHYRKYYKRYRSPMFFKAHALPAPEFKRVIYLLRDGRDAMVSYLHFLEAIERRRIDFLHLVQNGEGVFPCKWHEHIAQWLANPFQASMLIVRYEDLIRDTVQQLERILSFAGIERSPAQLRAAVCRSSFSSMQQREKEQGLGTPQWPKDRLFVRRGKVGSFRDEMPEPVQQAFLREAGPAMNRLGYSLA